MTCQPTATRPLYKFTDYRTSKGAKALAVQVSIADAAKFYAISSERTRRAEYGSNWDTITRYGHAHHPAMNRTISNVQDALTAMDEFEFPKDIKQAATRASRRLVSVFEEVTRLIRIDDLPSGGRLDRRKLPSVARHTASGDYDANVIRPYRRTEPRPAKVPTVAIVASAANLEMWSDAEYLPRIITLTLGILWACEAAGLNTYAALTAGHARPCETGIAEAIYATMLADPDHTISPRAFGIAFHRDLWRYSKMCAQLADWSGQQRLAQLGGSIAYNMGYAFPSRNGGNAVQFAREVLHADIVIAIGQITDAAQADIQLDATFNLDQAVEAVAAQAKTLRK